MSTIPTTSAAELEFQRWMKERVSHFEWFAEKMLPQTGIGAKRLVGAMRYSLLGGGKRIPPLLCYAAGAVSGAPEEVLDRAAAKLRSDSRALTLECGGEIFRVPLYEIRYLDVEKNYTTVHAKRDYTVKKTLGALSDELDERFFRIGRAAIVNLSYIRRVTKTDAILSDGAAVPLPRGAYEALNRAIIAYH